MRYVVIANPKAGSFGELASLLASVGESIPLPVWETRGPGHAVMLARRAVAEGYDGIVAAGGDGTIHEVVNGIAPDFERCRLVLLPLGTGNDLCRFLGASRDPDRLISALMTPADKRIDLLRLRLAERRTLYAVNAISAGFGGQVAESMNTEIKSKYGPLAFLLGAQRALSDLTRYRASLVLDDRESFVGDVLGIVFANGRSVAGGFEISPGSHADDGLLDIVILRDGGPLEFAELAARAATGDVLGAESVAVRAATHVALTSEPSMPSSVDGELVRSPLRGIELVDGALRVADAPESVSR